MKAQQTFVFIESNTTGTGELFIRKALAQGMSPIFVTKTPEKYAFLASFDIPIIVVDTQNVEAVFKKLKVLQNLSGIYSSSEYFIEMAAILARKLNLPANSPVSIANCRNKYKLFQLLHAASVPTPRSMLVRNLAEAEKVLESLPLPYVVKPVQGTGSIGVQLCITKEEYFAYIANAENKEILVQEYIDAPEFSVEVCTVENVHHIIGITQKYLSAPPHFIETGHDFPAELIPQAVEQIHKVVTQALEAVHFEFGMSHTELKLTTDGPVIIEINPRLAGGMIPVLVEKSIRIDLLDKAVAMYAGKKIHFKASGPQKFAAIRHVIPSISGHIKALGVNQKKKFSVEEEFHLLKKEGDSLLLQGDFRDRIAFVMTSHQDRVECRAIAQQALDSIEYKIQPFMESE